MSLLALCRWLESTRGSVALHESIYMYPLVESVHVWTLMVFFGLTAMLDLRLLGIAMRQIPVSDIARRLLPWTVAGFVVMVLSGMLLFYAIPVRTYHNVFFRAKMVMLLLAGLNVWVFHRGAWRWVSQWDLGVTTPTRAKAAGLLSLILWACIIFSGRMIAYNWFDCNKPQSGFVRTLAGCTSSPQASVASRIPGDGAS